MFNNLFPKPINPISIQGPVGQLEAIVSPPSKQELAIIAIICHPHPLYGGSMNNKVVTTIARALFDLDIWSIRFNFRGVGASEGHYDEGRGETEDLLAVLRWVKEMFPSHTIWLAGFSFGAYVATKVATLENDIAQLITIAPAVNHFDFNNFVDIHCPWLLIMGEEDEVVPVEEVRVWAKSLPVPMQIILLPGVTHFFHGHLVDLREQLKSNLSRNFHHY